MAQRLNILLLQIEMVQKARMVTKEQLTRIFALEVEAMRDEIDSLDRAAKRSGSLRDPVHREADRQVGWAYRLLHSFDAATNSRSRRAARRARPWYRAVSPVWIPIDTEA